MPTLRLFSIRHRFRLLRHLRRLAGLQTMLVLLVVVIIAGSSAATLHANPSLRTSLLEKLADLQGQPAPAPKPVTTIQTPAVKPAAELPNPSFTPEEQGTIAAGTHLKKLTTKPGESYYAGDLIIAPSVITIDRAIQGPGPTVTVSTPDGMVAPMPYQPYNDISPAGIIGAIVTPEYTNTWQMSFSQSSLAPDGTYKFHIMTTRQSGNDSWRYDGYLTVVLTTMAPVVGQTQMPSAPSAPPQTCYLPDGSAPQPCYPTNNP